MRKLLLAFGLLLVALAPAKAQCVAAGGVNTVPQVGVNCASEPNVNTFAATGIGIVPAGSATDIACLTGSASTVTRLQRITLSGSAGTLITVPAVLVFRQTADSGGTPATSTALPAPFAVDRTDGAPLATTIAYTANPTLNDATPGIIGAANLVLNATTASGVTATTFEFVNRLYAEAPTLRSAAQQICVNLNATSPSSGLVNVSFYWTEAKQ